MKEKLGELNLTLVRIINQGVLVEEDSSPCDGNKEPFIEMICKDQNGMYYICDCGMKPVSQGYSSIEELAKSNNPIGVTELNDLQKLAIQMYCNDVKVDSFKENFIKKINDGIPVFDMREKGLYCSTCGSFSKEIQMGEGERVIFLFNGIFEKEQEQIWIISAHYDGCRGWD